MDLGFWVADNVTDFIDNRKDEGKQQLPVNFFLRGDS